MEQRVKFNERVLDMFKAMNKDRKHFIFTRERYDDYVTILRKAKPNCSKDYHIRHTYKLDYHMGVDVLVEKKNDYRIIYIEQIYDTIKEAHSAAGHKGEKTTYRFIKKHSKVGNVSMRLIKAFIANCSSCQQRRKALCPKKVVIQPIISSHFGERVQVDLINMSSEKHPGGWNYILNYQDHATKFIILRPLKTKKSEEVSACIKDIMYLFGPPSILHTDNGGEFVSLDSLIQQEGWSTHIVKGRPYHPESQGSVERANRDVLELLKGILLDNVALDWVSALQQIQYIKNISHHRTIEMSPHQAVFGQHNTSENLKKNAKKMITPITTPTVGIYSKVLIPIPKVYKKNKLCPNNLVGYVISSEADKYTILSACGSVLKETFTSNQFEVVSIEREPPRFLNNACPTVDLKTVIMGLNKKKTSGTTHVCSYK